MDISITDRNLELGEIHSFQNAPKFPCYFSCKQPLSSFLHNSTVNSSCIYMYHPNKFISVSQTKVTGREREGGRERGREGGKVENS